MIELNIIGRIGADATSKQVNGQTVINFSVAHSYSYTNQQGQKVESTIWVKCDYWVKRDAITQYLKKGTLVYCSGVPRAEGWQGDDRSIRTNLRVNVREVQLLGGGKRENDNNSNVTQDEVNHLENTAAGDVPTFGNTDPAAGDDLPF